MYINIRMLFPQPAVNALKGSFFDNEAVALAVRQNSESFNGLDRAEATGTAFIGCYVIDEPRNFKPGITDENVLSTLRGAV